MVTTLTTQQKLDAAEAALHLHLTTGAVRVFVDQNGERLEYSVPSAARLRGYILELQTSLGIAPTIQPLTPRLL